MYYYGMPALMGVSLSIALTGLLLFLFADRFHSIPVFTNEARRALTPLNIFNAVVVVPLIEEFLFRFLFYRCVKKLLSLFFPRFSQDLMYLRKFRGFSVYFNSDLAGIVALFFSALAFGLYHNNMVQGIYASCFGVLFCFIYEKTGRLDSSYFVHMMINFLSLFVNLGIFFSTPGFTVFSVLVFFTLFVYLFYSYFRLGVFSEGAGSP